MFENPLIRRSQLQRRDYQVGLAEAATRNNLLVVLPTALGKTEIAALAASRFLWNHWDRKVLVMAPTRPLVAQHRERFLRLLRIKKNHTRVLTGEIDPAQRMREWSSPEVKLFFSTPQTVWKDHERGLGFSCFSFIVFDECHRSRLRYDYTKIAEAYTRECRYPIILGLTASPGATREKIAEICRALMIERVEVRVEEDPDVKQYVHPVRVEWKKVELPEDYRALSDALRKMELARIEVLKGRGLIPKPSSAVGRRDLIELQQKLVNEARRDKSAWPMIMRAAEATQISHLRELLESQGKEALLSRLERMRAENKRTHRAVLADLDAAGFEARVRVLREHPKVSALKTVLSEQLFRNAGSKILIFNQYRDSIRYLVSCLRKEGIKAEMFVGQADRGVKGMNQEEQLRVLEELRKGSLHAIVASSVAEEGLDIPSADLVVFYEPVPSEIRYIQRRGRTGRVKVGKAVVLIADRTVDTAYMWVSMRKVKRMREMLRRLEAELQPLPRGPEPALCPMSAEEMAPEEPGIEEVRPEEVRREEERRFRRELRHNVKSVLSEVLSIPGASVDQLAATFGISRSDVLAAVEKLSGEGMVALAGERVFPAGLQQGSTHTLEVKRVLRGKAIVRVNEKWYAVLDAGDYNGPRFLLKPGTKFAAASELYRADGRLHVRVFSVVRAGAD